MGAMRTQTNASTGSQASVDSLHSYHSRKVYGDGNWEGSSWSDDKSATCTATAPIGDPWGNYNKVPTHSATTHIATSMKKSNWESSSWSDDKTATCTATAPIGDPWASYNNVSTYRTTTHVATSVQ